jgi:hypothetical protein
MARRFIVPALVIAAVVLAAPASARTSAIPWKPPTLKSKLPAPGHITVELDRFTHQLGRGQRAPKKFTVRPKKPKSLPASVRVIWASRVIETRKSVTLSILQVAINAAKPATPARIAAKQTETPALELYIQEIWTKTESERIGASDYTSHVHVQGWKAEQLGVENADLATPTEIHPLFQGIQDDYTDKKTLRTLFEESPPLDTGHYDDGHAFGWKSTGTREAFKDVTGATLQTESFKRIVLPLEDDLVVDIDGDGLAGPPPCVAGSFDTETVDVTNPNGSAATTPFAYFWHTPIWDWYYWEDYGEPGGCDFDHGKAQVNIGLYDSSGTLVSWNYDWPPYPTPPDSSTPVSFYSGSTCITTESNGDGATLVRRWCDVGVPVLHDPPPEEGYVGRHWPEVHQIYYPVVALVDAHRGEPEQHSAELHAHVEWRPTP